MNGPTWNQLEANLGLLRTILGPTWALRSERPVTAAAGSPRVSLEQRRRAGSSHGPPPGQAPSAIDVGVANATAERRVRFG